jgi:hypothetical protein
MLSKSYYRTMRTVSQIAGVSMLPVKSDQLFYTYLPPNGGFLLKPNRSQL